MRRPVQVLVLPFIVQEGSLSVFILFRKDAKFWQFVAGGVEGEETPVQAAIRELKEEIGVTVNDELIRLETISSIPACAFGDCKDKEWSAEIIVIPEYCFAVKVASETISLSHEHSSYRLVKPEFAYTALKFDSNKTALYELTQKFKLGMI